VQILQKPVDLVGQPKDVDRSEGRFLALYNGFLDVAVYAKGREVTVAGEVKEKRVLPLGEIEYSYPLIHVRELHLWPDRSKEKPIPPPYWNYPWWYAPPHWGP
jgi:outer membrane lipoprotein